MSSVNALGRHAVRTKASRGMQRFAHSKQWHTFTHKHVIEHDKAEEDLNHSYSLIGGYCGMGITVGNLSFRILSVNMISSDLARFNTKWKKRS